MERLYMVEYILVYKSNKIILCEIYYVAALK